MKKLRILRSLIKALCRNFISYSVTWCASSFDVFSLFSPSLPSATSCGWAEFAAFDAESKNITAELF